ncbi:MAG TPA: formylglycine-generating enzyme family protein [Cyclobacteriaceae bacterium]|jgi:formylglycine-generating enzyme required for sulfatase activity|nr:formylglycine-generating enzyme family protein [Cyclobacteriaceae bacterium]
MTKHACFITIIVICAISSWAQKSLKPGEVFRDCPDCPEMVVIPGGSFTMGSTADEVQGYPLADIRVQLEGPQRVVNIKQFAVGKFNITRGQWAAFVADTNRPTRGGCRWSGLPAAADAKPWDPHPDATWKNLGFAQDDTHPVVCVTWNDAQDYVKWLSKKTGSTYRLLTEAEWEYAARAGTTTTFPWGDTASHEYANYGTDTVAGVGFTKGRDQWMYTSPVGAFPPNAFGLHDMHGNILEWVEDCFSPTYAGLPTDGSAYTTETTLDSLPGPFARMNGSTSCSFKMCRGGDAWDHPILIRSASRTWAMVAEENYGGTAGLGIRVAKNLP